MASFSIRGARSDDHAAFTGLVPELSVDDPIPSSERFAKEMIATTLAAVDAEDRWIGYVFYSLAGGVAYVHHLVTAPGARRRGVARALLGGVADRARAAGATAWGLSVRPDNVAARALYESVGLRAQSSARAYRVEWAPVDEALDGARVTARTIEPAEDALVEARFEILPGRLAAARAQGRILLALESGGELAGAAIFDPDFPATSQFRVRDASLVVPFLKAIRPYARPGADYLNVAAEAEPPIYDALAALGAKVRLEIVRMRGPLTP